MAYDRARGTYPPTAPQATSSGQRTLFGPHGLDDSKKFCDALIESSDPAAEAVKSAPWLTQQALQTNALGKEVVSTAGRPLDTERQHLTKARSLHPSLVQLTREEQLRNIVDSINFVWPSLDLLRQ